MGRVKAVYRVIKILKMLAETKAMSLTEINTKLGIPKSSAFDIISTLKQEGFVSIGNNHLKKYSLGISSFEVGSAYLSQLNFTSLVHPSLEKLATEFKTTAFLAVEDQGNIIYIDKFEPPTATRTTLPLGLRTVMYRASLGKALLACYPIDKVKQIIGDEFSIVPKTKRTITSYDQLIKELEITRQRGYAIDDREDNDNIFCLGVPIFGDKSQPIAAISLSFLYYEIKNNNINIVANQLKKTALEISHKLGYNRSVLYS